MRRTANHHLPPPARVAAALFLSCAVLLVAACGKPAPPRPATPAAPVAPTPPAGRVAPAGPGTHHERPVRAQGASRRHGAACPRPRHAHRQRAQIRRGAAARPRGRVPAGHHSHGARRSGDPRHRQRRAHLDLRCPRAAGRRLRARQDRVRHRLRGRPGRGPETQRQRRAGDPGTGADHRPDPQRQLRDGRQRGLRQHAGARRAGFPAAAAGGAAHRQLGRARGVGRIRGARGRGRLAAADRGHPARGAGYRDPGPARRRAATRPAVEERAGARHPGRARTAHRQQQRHRRAVLLQQGREFRCSPAASSPDRLGPQLLPQDPERPPSSTPASRCARPHPSS